MSPPALIKSLQLTTSAAINPFLKSVWIVPAASGALAPLGIVHALLSFGPDVKKVIRLLCHICAIDN